VNAILKLSGLIDEEADPRGALPGGLDWGRSHRTALERALMEEEMDAFPFACSARGTRLHVVRCRRHALTPSTSRGRPTTPYRAAMARIEKG